MVTETTRIFISSKFTTNANFFKTLDEAIAEFDGDFSGYEIVFEDRQNNITPEQFKAVSTALAIYGNINDDNIYNIQAENALTLTLTLTDAYDSMSINNFLTVSVNNSNSNIDFKKFNVYKEKNETYTYKFDGSFTATNSYIEEVTNYKTVSLLNTSVGGVYLDDLTKSYPNDDEEWVDVCAAGGTFTARLSETAEDNKEYNIGFIEGYSNVTISGLNDELFAEKKSMIVITSDIHGGASLDRYVWDALSSYCDFGYNDGSYYSIGSISITDNVKVVDATIGAFASVTVKNANVLANINGGYNYSCKTSTKKISYNEYGETYSWYEGTETISVKGGNKLTAENAVISNVLNYDTVTLTNILNAGNISRDTFAKISRKGYGEGDKNSISYYYSDEYTITYAAAGSLTVNANASFKTVEDAPRVMFIGNVGNDLVAVNGYSKVTISGLAHKSDRSLDVAVSVDGDIVGGNAVCEYNYGDEKITPSSSGSVTLGSGVSVNGNIKNFTTVTLGKSIANGNIDRGQLTVSEKESKIKKSKKTDEMGDKYVEYSWSNTVSYKGEGELTAANSRTGNIINYQTVTLTNSDSGNISRDTFAKQVDSYEYEDCANEGFYKEDKQLIDSTRTYSAGGTLTIKADKNFVADEDDVRMISIGRSITPEKTTQVVAIKGYSKVTVSGHRDKKNADLNVSVGITGSIIGGSRVENVQKDEEGYVYDENSYLLSSESSVGSVTVNTDVTVDGNIEGFTTVTLKDNAVIKGNIERRGFKVTEKTKTKNYSSYPDYQDRIITTTKTYNGDGKLTAANSRTENIINYQTVTLTNTHAGDIIRDQLAKEEDSLFQSRWKEEGVWSDWESDGYEEPTHKWYTSSGSLTVKADKTALNNAEKVETEYDLDSGEYYDNEETEYRFNIGNISGYEKVTLTGYDNLDCYISVKNISGGNSDDNEYSKNYSAVGSAALTDVMAAGSIRGFDKVTLTESEVDGKVIATDENSATDESDENYICGSVSTKYSDNSEFSSDYYSSSTTVKSAAKFTAKDSCVGMSWNEDVILGYKTVSITDESHINGGINFGDAFTEKFESKDKVKSSKGTITSTDTNTYSYKETKDGSLTVKDSYIYGSVTGYNKVTVTNSGIGYQDFYGEEWLGEVEVRNWAYSSSATVKYQYTSDYETFEEKELSNSAKEEFNASGSFTCTIDKKAEHSAYHIGSVAGFAEVTISGYNGAKMFVNGSIRSGKVVNSGTSADYLYGYGFDWDEKTSAVSASGSVSISKNVLVKDDILGFNKVSISNSRVDDIDSRPDSEDFLDYSEDINWEEVEVVGSSVNLSDAFADDIYGYKSVTASGKYNEIGSYSGTSSDDTFKVSKNSALRLASLDFGEGTKDKLVIDGTLIFAANEEAEIAIYGVDSISGSGEIAASSTDLETVKTALDGKFSKFLDLGATSEGFRGRKEELADNKENNAVKWDISMDNEYTGWLGGDDLAFSDTVDYIKVCTDDLKINLDIDYNDSEVDFIVEVKNLTTGEFVNPVDSVFALAADSDYLIKLDRGDEKGSTSYTITAKSAEII